MRDNRKREGSYVPSLGSLELGSSIYISLISTNLGPCGTSLASGVPVGQILCKRAQPELNFDENRPLLEYQNLPFFFFLSQEDKSDRK